MEWWSTCEEKSLHALKKKTMENTFEEGISMEIGLQYFCQIVEGLDYCWIHSQTRNFLYQDHT